MPIMTDEEKRDATKGLTRGLAAGPLAGVPAELLNLLQKQINDAPTSADLLEKLKRISILLFAPSGAGKTWAALTLDPEFPTEKRTGKEALLRLSKTLVILYDPDGLAGINEAGIYPLVIDIQDLMRPPREGEVKAYAADITQATEYALQAAERMVLNHGVENVIVDTVTTYSQELVDYWFGKLSEMFNGSTQQLWGRVKTDTLELRRRLVRLPCRTVFLCHASVNEAEFADPDKLKGASAKTIAAAEKEAAKAEATGGPGGNLVVPMIYGSARDIFRRHSSLQLVVKSQMKSGVGSNVDFERWIEPYGSDTEQGKNRFQLSLRKKEPANLSEIIARIERTVRGGEKV